MSLSDAAWSAQVPAKVTGVTASNGASYNKVSISWRKSTKALTYLVYRSIKSGTKGLLVALGLPGTSYDDTVSDSTRYFYTVVGVNAIGNSPDSAQVEGWGKMPAAIADLTATQNTIIGKVSLSWTPNVDATGYEIWRSDSVAGTPTLLSTVGAVSSFEDTSVVGTNHYFYTVKVKVDALIGEASNQAEGWGGILYLLQVSGVTATQGSLTGKVFLSWNAIPDAESYEIWRYSEFNAVPELIATQDGTSYEDSSITDETLFYYTVKGKTRDWYGPSSNVTVGWANVAPISASVKITTTWPNVRPPISPVVNDPNINAGQDDLLTYTITEQPTKGTVTIENGGFVYTPTAGVGYYGDFNFKFIAKDKAGESVIGSGLVHVLQGCFAPTIMQFSSENNLLPEMHPNYTIKYDAKDCNGAMDATLSIIKDGMEVDSSLFALPDYGSPVVFLLPGKGLKAGDYTAKLTVVTEIGISSQSFSLKVNDVILPDLIIDPKIADQGKSNTTVSINPKDSICTLTADQSIAEADPRKCFVSLNGTVPGLSPGKDAQNLPILTGYPREAGDFPVTINTSRWVDGVRYDLSQVSDSLTVTSASLPKFSLIGDADVIQNIEKVQLKFKQTDGDLCTIFSDLDKAKAAAETSRKIVCFAEFTIPNGINMLQGIDKINFEGFLSEIGTSQITYSVSQVYPDRTILKIPVGGALTMTVSKLVPPSFDLKGGREISAGRFYVPLGQPVTRLRVLTNFPTSAKMNLTIDDGVAIQQRYGLLNKSFSWIKTPELKLMEQRSIKIRLSWVDYPEIFTEKTITAIGGTQNAIKLIMDAQRLVTDTEDVIVKVKVGTFTKDGFVYDPATMGQWRVQLLTQSNTQSKSVPTTQVVDMVNGEAEYRFTLSGYLFMKVTAVAQLVTDIPDLDIPIKSQTRFIEVLNGSPLQGTITSKGLDGPAPKIFSLTLDQTPDNRGALKEVSWEESVDDGATWKTIENADQVKTNVALLEPGRKKIRAKMVNKNNLIESYTDPVELWAYSKLEGAVIGPTATAPDVPVTLSAELYRDGGKVDNAVIEWTVDYGNEVMASHSGPTVAISDTKEGKANVIMKARSADTRADDPYAWNYARYYVLIRNPLPPAVQAYGPKSVETGKTYHYTGKTKPSWGTLESVQKLVSEWQLPDGSMVAGNELDWTPTPDVIATPTPLIYRAWVDGFKDSTVKEIPVAYLPWEYVWPNWTITMKQGTAEAPSDLILLVDQDRRDMVSRFEGLTYEWIFPENVTGRPNSSFPNRAAAQVVYEGTYTISVKVRDARGNQTTLTQDVTAIAAAPYVAMIKVSKSNMYDRAPMTVTVRPTVSGGHPLDSIDTQTWTVDGSIISEFNNRSYLYTGIPNAGDHVIGYEMKSKMGVTARIDAVLPLAPNKNPECSLVQTSGSMAVYVEAKCTDPDGKVVGYTWAVNGNPLSSTSYRIGLSRGSIPQTATISFFGIDDAGGKSQEASLVVNY